MQSEKENPCDTGGGTTDDSPLEIQHGALQHNLYTICCSQSQQTAEGIYSLTQGQKTENK